MAREETAPGDLEVHARAALSEGKSRDEILSAVSRSLRDRSTATGHGTPAFETLVDLGCGRGDCARHLAGLYGTYVGCDIVQYPGFPRSDSNLFREVDLNQTPYPLQSGSADAIVSVETIEHIENPRALLREMARIVRPGGVVVVTTPNQLSLASKLHLVLLNEFLAFQAAPGLYPAHITALVEEDLRRIARECGLTDVEIRYTDHGRIPLTARPWPRRAKGRWFSDNVVLVAARPAP